MEGGFVFSFAPGSGQRLTARNNTTRTRIVWKLDEATQTKVPVQEEISNRRVCVDFTFSVPKSVSMYLARTKDTEVEKLILNLPRFGGHASSK